MSLTFRKKNSEAMSLKKRSVAAARHYLVTVITNRAAVVRYVMAGA